MRGDILSMYVLYSIDALRSSAHPTGPRRDSLAFFNRPGEIAFDQVPSGGEIGLARRQYPNAMQMIREDNYCIHVKGHFSFTWLNASRNSSTCSTNKRLLRRCARLTVKNHVAPGIYARRYSVNVCPLLDRCASVLSASYALV
jgi:hypothetical protein